MILVGKVCYRNFPISIRILLVPSQRKTKEHFYVINTSNFIRLLVYLWPTDARLSGKVCYPVLFQVARNRKLLQRNTNEVETLEGKLAYLK